MTNMRGVFLLGMSDLSLLCQNKQVIIEILYELKTSCNEFTYIGKKREIIWFAKN